jgi:hypothetical protein
MLLLNETTLFYFSLGKQAQPQGKVSGVIKDWADKVSRSVQPPTKGPIGSSTSGSSRPTKSGTLSTGTAVNSAASVPTSFRSTSSAAKDANTKATSKPSSKQPFEVVKFGGIDSGDETEEREAALSSPIKGGKRLTSVVRVVMS